MKSKKHFGLLLLTVLWIFSCSKQDSIFNDVGKFKVKFISGRVVKSTSPNFLQASSVKLGETLDCKYWLKTLSGSMCELSWGKATIVMRENAVLGLKNIVDSESNLVMLYLDNGAAGFKVEKLDKGDEFRVLTINSILAVRGTEFEIVRSRNVVSVSVNEGKVVLAPFIQGVPIDRLLDKVAVSLERGQRVDLSDDFVDELRKKFKESGSLDSIGGMFKKKIKHILLKRRGEGGGVRGKQKNGGEDVKVRNRQENSTGKKVKDSVEVSGNKKTDALLKDSKAKNLTRSAESLGSDNTVSPKKQMVKRTGKNVEDNGGEVETKKKGAVSDGSQSVRSDVSGGDQMSGEQQIKTKRKRKLVFKTRRSRKHVETTKGNSD